MRPTRLYINIDHVATVREARKTDEPDPVAAARLCQEAPLTLDEAQLALSALRALAGPSRSAAIDALLGIAERHKLEDVAKRFGPGPLERREQRRLEGV